MNYDPRIIDTNVSYGDSFSVTYFANTDGTFIEQERAEVILTANAVAREGDNVQTAHDSFSSRDTFSYVTNRDDEIRRIAKLAVDLLSAKSVEGGVYPVVLNPNLSGVFIHEAFGHLSEADNIVENPQAQKMMTLGRKFGPEILNVYDDGSLFPLKRGSISYDDEGVATKRNYLILKGELVGRLHSRETAAKLNEEPTGNARAMSYDSVPLIRMTNTCIEKGETSFEDMIKDIELGVYALDAYGGQTMLENFSFSAGYGYMIRNGKIAEMVKDVVLQGNLFKTLANIEAIGDDFTFGLSGGNCGKGGQSIPVSMGSPHIRIKDVMIGGK